MLSACATPSATSSPTGVETQSIEPTSSPTHSFSLEETLPLEDFLDNLQPRDVFQNFYNIT
jgi:hypothetical protein